MTSTKDNYEQLAKSRIQKNWRLEHRKTETVIIYRPTFWKSYSIVINDMHLMSCMNDMSVETTLEGVSIRIDVNFYKEEERKKEENNEKYRVALREVEERIIKEQGVDDGSES